MTSLEEKIIAYFKGDAFLLAALREAVLEEEAVMYRESLHTFVAGYLACQVRGDGDLAWLLLKEMLTWLDWQHILTQVLVGANADDLKT